MMNYLELLDQLHAALRPRAYLEIGSELGEALRLSRTRSIAVDPEPRLGQEALSGKPWVKLYRESSDTFFRTHTVEAVLEGAPLDLAVIDGLHEFVQVVRDFENIERWSHPETTIVFHDVLPRTPWQATRARHDGAWTGDVWRIVPFLREHRPDLTCYLVNVWETGALVVTGVDPKHRGMTAVAATLDRDFPADGPDYDRVLEQWLATVQPITPEAVLRTLAPVRIPVCIVGMHRSGTSMVAKLLQGAGLHLGTNADLMPANWTNPEGFFEHLGFVRLNDDILHAAGASWDRPPPANFDWHARRLDRYRARARLLADAMQARSPWGWKDPRSSLTIPFWRSVLGPLQVVVVIRNPLEVAMSLNRRDDSSIEFGLTLWRIYAERLLETTSPNERIVTHLDAYFRNPDHEIARVLRLAGLNDDQDIPALRVATLPELRHHQRTERDLEAEGVPADIIALYRRLCAEASVQNA